MIAMWNFTSKALAGSIGLRNGFAKPSHTYPDCSDDDAASSCTSKEDGLECLICWESFNMVENVPYVLWCGHTLCKNCVMGLQWAVVKFPNLPVQLPLFISCPWCHLLSLRLVYKGILKFPRKNFFLLWMIESMTGERAKSPSSYCTEQQLGRPSSSSLPMGSTDHHRRFRSVPQLTQIDQSVTNRGNLGTPTNGNYWDAERIQSSLRMSLVFLFHLTSRFPLIIIFLLVVIYAIPASAVILALYILVTVLLALPALLILYFAYPSLDWLVREIIT